MELLVKELWNSEEAKMLQSSSQTETTTNFLKETKEIIIENWKKIWVLTLWVAINTSLFIWKFIENKNKQESKSKVMGYCIGIAKGSAETLKFNMALILFLVCRGALTTLKTSKFLSSIFSFDDHIYYHMIVGSAISVATFVHVIMHLGCGFPMLLILGHPITYFDLVFGTVPGVTGILMVIIMAYCFTLAIPKLRNSKNNLRHSFYQYFIGFNAFWYAHHLLFLVYVLMIFHGYFESLAWDWLNRTVRISPSRFINFLFGV